MEITTIHSWNEFDAVARDLDGWAFRGQRDAQWPLLSSLSRHLKDFVPDKTCWRERKTRAIQIFRRKSHNYVSKSLILDDQVRSLALLLHLGASTQLLYFTYSQ